MVYGRFCHTLKKSTVVFFVIIIRLIMMMLIQTIWLYIKQKEWQDCLEYWYALLVQEGNNLDIALGEKGREILAAGVFFEGRKTTENHTKL